MHTLPIILMLLGASVVSVILFRRMNLPPMLGYLVVGSLIGLIQTDVKRLLAYSSIAHAGFILVGVVGAVTTANGLADDRVGSVAAILVYLAAYGLATMGAFAIVTLVRRSGAEATSFAAWSGLGRRDPLLGGLVRAVASVLDREFDIACMPDEVAQANGIAGRNVSG